MNSAAELSKASNKTATVSKAAIALIFALIGVIASFGFSMYIDQVNNESQAKFSDLRRTLINIESEAFNAQLGNPDAFNQLFTSQQSVNNTLETLLKAPFINVEALNAFSTHWQQNETHIEKLLQAEQTIRLSRELSQQMDAMFPNIELKTESIITQLIGLNIEPNLVFLASHQLSLLQGMKSNLHHLENKQQDATRTLSLIRSDSKTYLETLDKLLSGDKSLGIKSIKNLEVRESVDDLKQDFAKVNEISTRLAELMVRLNMSKNAYNKVHDITHNLFEESNTLSGTFIRSDLINRLATVCGYILATLCLFLAGTLIFPKTKQTEFTALVQNIDENLNTDDDLSDTYPATAVNNIVNNIQTTSEEVFNVAEEAQATATHLSMASEKQANHISTITDAIQKITTLFEAMSEHATESADLASKTVNMAENGHLAVKNTISSMKTINENIDETSNRIKRLGESSQEIGDIVELINDIAEQTHILALNAAIKASSRNNTQDFSRVADEIQQLAERVSQATRKIESLVTSIQQDTNQAVVSMEQSSADVINGSKLAEAAGNALGRIENVSTHLAAFISDVANEATTIKQSANKISGTMNNIKVFTDQNLAGTKQTANLNGKLAKLAKDQREAIEGFSNPINNKQEQ